MSGYGSYIFPAIAPLIIHQTIVLGLGMLLAGYREQKWQPTTTEFFAIFCAILTIGMLGCLYLFGFIYWLNDYPHGGNFSGMLLAVPIFIGCIVALGMLISTFFDMPERPGHVIVFTSIPLFLLSGTAWPHAAMPAWMQYLGNVLPSTQGIQMFIQLNQMGVPTVLILPKLLYLFVFGIACAAFAYWRLKHR